MKGDVLRRHLLRGRGYICEETRPPFRRGHALLFPLGDAFC